MTPYSLDLFGKGSFDQGSIDKLKPGLEKVCTMIQRRLSTTGKPYVAGTDQPTIADIKTYEYLAVSVGNEKAPMSADLRQQLKDVVAKYPLAERYMTQTMKTVMGSYEIKSPC